MPVVIRLLGTPSIEGDGVPERPPRGRKSWALLAYLVLAERPPSRQRLAGLLFADAEDPLGALRWSLAEIRRGLRSSAQISGDPVTIRFTDVAQPAIDVIDLIDSAYRLGDEGELLEGMTFDGCDAFETWLLVQRRRLAGVVEAMLREESLRLLTAGRPGEAVGLAMRLVARNPLDDNSQELLVRCLVAAGDRTSARRQVEICELFRRPAAIPPAGQAPSSPAPAQVSPRAGIALARAQLESGHSAISAGAIDAGLAALRQAASAAGAAGDQHLRIEALVELGGALVHAAQGRNEEGAVVLHEALAAARERGDTTASVRACRELGFVDVQAGRRDRAEKWLAEAELLADGDATELAAILGVHGMNLSDSARYAEALDTLAASVEQARRAGARRQQAWSLSLIGRCHSLRGDRVEARAVIEECLALVRDERWTAFSPWPQALLADVDLAEQRYDQAADGYSQAFALGCHLGDPCWEGTAAKGLGLLEARTGSLAQALALLDDGRSRCTRWPDPYQWVHASVLDATCDVAISAGDARAPGAVEELADLAARTGMREFVVRSHLHRARLGRPGAIAAAAMGAADIDNPMLAELLDRAGR